MASFITNTSLMDSHELFNVRDLTNIIDSYSLEYTLKPFSNIT
jgi:hypothetical protein